MKKLIVIGLLMVVLCGCGPKQTNEYFIQLYRSAGEITPKFSVKQNLIGTGDRVVAIFSTLDEAVIYKARLDSLIAMHSFRGEN